MVIYNIFFGNISAIKATTLKVTFNKPVNDAKTSFEVKKNSIAVNVAKTEWSEDKMSANLTMVAKLSKGDYTVSVSTDTEKGVTGVATVEDEKVAKLELASDKLVITKDDMTEGKVGYVVYNQYGEDVTTKTSLFNIDWNVSPATGKSADKGVLTLTNTAKYQLDQKVVITALEKNTGYFMSATVTVSKKAYVNEVAIGEVKSDDAKITTLNVANIAHFFFPVTLKDQYGNVIKDKTAANAELLAIKANIDGAFDNDADGNLIFKLAPAVSQIAGKASLTFVTVNSGNRASKEFDIIANPAIADFTMELPEVIAAGDTKVPVKFSAVDQFGNAVTSVTDLTAALANLGVSGASLAKTDFTFAKDVKTGVISLTLNAQNATAGRVFITMLTPGNKVFTTNFEVKEARKPVVVSGINSKLITNYVVNSTGAIKSEDITILDQYGKAWSLKDLASTVKVNLTVSDATITTLSATELTGGDTNVAIVPKAKGTVTVTADIVGVSDSSYSFKLNVVEAKDVVSYEVADIATLNGNVGSTADIKVTGKLANGQEVALDYTVIKSIVSANTSVVTVDAAARKVTAVQNADVTLADATANVIVTIDGANGPVVVTKPVKVSYKKAAPAKIEADSENTNIVNGVAYVADTTDMKTLFVVTDQYGATLTDTLTIVKTGVTETGCDVTAITSNGLTAQLKVLYTK